MGSWGSVHPVKFWDSSLKYTEHIKPKIQRRHIFADLAIYHICTTPLSAVPKNTDLSFFFLLTVPYTQGLGPYILLLIAGPSHVV